MKEIQCGQASDYCGHDRREQDREWMHVAFVKNSQNYIHNKDRGEQQQGQGTEQLLEHERFSLENTLHGGVLRMDLREGVLDELGGIADGDVWQQVEVERDTGELIQMVHSLRANDFFCRCYDTQWDEARHVTCSCSDGPSTRAARAEITAGAAADVEIIQVPRVRPLLVFDFENDLVLIVGFLDEINVVLRVRVAHQTLDRRSRNTGGRGAIPVDGDTKIWRVVVVIGAYAGETFKLSQFFHQLIGDSINVLRHDAANSVRVLALGLARGTDADLQYRTGRKHRSEPTNGPDGFLQPQNDFVNGRPLAPRLQKEKHQAL